jgi:hypothetical protein
MREPMLKLMFWMSFLSWVLSRIKVVISWLWVRSPFFNKKKIGMWVHTKKWLQMRGTTMIKEKIGIQWDRSQIRVGGST